MSMLRTPIAQFDRCSGLLRPASSNRSVSLTHLSVVINNLATVVWVSFSSRIPSFQQPRPQNNNGQYKVQSLRVRRPRALRRFLLCSAHSGCDWGDGEQIVAIIPFYCAFKFPKLTTVS
ncbi:unnamed protein product [Litomosoides sigmodontis]|uniref:Uncharacterized protein n=1 Tax=Litomosoides sigmodontis TaxID=42156 RepID=A0A3P6U4K2_LITSI|nr:unnamed protein product [Litomosoides sigmodontis]